MRNLIIIRTSWGVIATVAVLGLGLSTSGAIAGKKLKTKSQTVEADAGERASATARCKRGTTAVSGGFEADPVVFGEPTPFYFLDRSSRPAGRRWTSEGPNQGAIGGAPGDLTSYAYCRNEAVRSKSGTESVAPGEIETASAKCKRGTKPVSGGFDAEEVDPAASNSPFFIVTTSRKSGRRGWEVRALNTGDATGELTAQVNCREGKGLKTRPRSEEFEDDDVLSLDANCKRNQRVVSGGFAGPDFVGAEGLIPFTSMKVGKRGWHLAGLATGEVTAYAYCEKK